MSLAISTRRSTLMACQKRAGPDGKALACDSRLYRLFALQERNLLVGECAMALLPGRRLVDPHDFNRRHLVLRTVRCPVRVFRGDDVGARLRKVEGRVNHAGTDPIG